MLKSIWAILTLLVKSKNGFVHVLKSDDEIGAHSNSLARAVKAAFEDMGKEIGWASLDKAVKDVYYVRYSQIDDAQCYQWKEIRKMYSNPSYA